MPQPRVRHRRRGQRRQTREWRGRGKTSGVFANWRYGTVLTLRDAKITSMISYTDPAEALEAVGLRE